MIKRIICVCLSLILLMTMASCKSAKSNTSSPKKHESKVSKTDDSSSNSKYSKDVSPIIRASDYFGVTPDTMHEDFEGFNGTVSLQQCKEYASYIESCGYTENTAVEKKNAERFDFIKSYIGNNDTQFVIITYTSGVGSVGYGESCTFSKSNSQSESNTQSNYTPYYPDVSIKNDTKTRCPICKGTGKVVCSSCKGSGKLYTTEYAPDLGGGGGGSYKVGHTCMNCSGSGKSMCTRCVGCGYIY